MKFSPESIKLYIEKEILRFSAASLAPLLALAVIGWLIADNWGTISYKATTLISHRGFRDAAYVDVPRMTVSLGGSASTRIQVDITLEVPKKDADVLEGYLPKIMDRLNVYLPKIKADELKNPDAMFMLHKEMLYQINNIGIPVKVNDVVLQNLVIL